MKQILIFILLHALIEINAKPNECCPDNAPIRKSNCSNNKPLFSCKDGAYIMFTNEIQQNEDDTITDLESKIVIEKDRYCLGSIENKTDTIVLICFPDDNGESEEISVKTIICSIISIACLLLTLIVYILLPNLRDLQGKCMMPTIFSLIMAFFFLALAQKTDYYEATCFAIASSIYFWFLCIFFWLNIVAFNVWRSVVKPNLLSNKKYIYWFYSAYGWGGPIILLIITIICHHTPGEHLKPDLGKSTCWFPSSKQRWAYFYAPITILIILNIIMFIWTALNLWEENKTYTDKKHQSHKFKFCLYLKLSIIMGICWIFEPLSELFHKEGSYIWFVTDLINALQGLIIFLLLVVFRKRVRRDLAKHGMCCNRLPKHWQTMPDEDCEELEEDIDEIPTVFENNQRAPSAV